MHTSDKTRRSAKYRCTDGIKYALGIPYDGLERGGGGGGDERAFKFWALATTRTSPYDLS